MSKEYLVKFEDTLCYYGSGIIDFKIMEESEFVEFKKILRYFAGSEYYFGEVAGKHSEVCADLGLENFDIIEDEKVIEAFKLVHGNHLYTVGVYDTIFEQYEDVDEEEREEEDE